jgi:hypothetical protein
VKIKYLLLKAASSPPGTAAGAFMELNVKIKSTPPLNGITPQGRCALPHLGVAKTKT